MIQLYEALIGKKYLVEDIQFCDDCPLSDNSCTILGLMERGLVPGSLLIIKSKKLGLFEMDIDGITIVIRNEELDKYKIYLKDEY